MRLHDGRIQRWEIQCGNWCIVKSRGKRKWNWKCDFEIQRNTFIDTDGLTEELTYRRGIMDRQTNRCLLLSLVFIVLPYYPLHIIKYPKCLAKKHSWMKIEDPIMPLLNFFSLAQRYTTCRRMQINTINKTCCFIQTTINMDLLSAC